VTQYNNRTLFTTNGGAAAISDALTGLRTGWLQGAEQIISTYYGITGDSAALNINLQQGAASAANWISGTVDVNGLLTNINMTFDPNTLASAANPARIVARSLTQAVMARNSNYNVLRNQYAWFVSGASDFIAGGNDMVQTALQSASAASIVSAANGAWVDDLTHQASAYIAVKYLNQQLIAAGSSMADVMSWLKSGVDLDAALSFTLGMDVATFMGDFQANGGAYLNSLISSGTLAGPDVGGIHPGTAATVIPGGTYSLNPTTGFKILWPPADNGSLDLTLQVGAQAQDHLTVSLPHVSRAALDLLGINVQLNAQDSITRFGSAISKVSTARTQLGAAANALEHTASVATQEEVSSRDSYSRIRDVDFAHEVTNETKQQILVSATGLVLSKASRLREHAAWLLSALPTSMPGASAG
jgi:flagellin-like hook-associated protein FlgL